MCRLTLPDIQNEAKLTNILFKIVSFALIEYSLKNTMSFRGRYILNVQIKKEANVVLNVEIYYERL